MSSSKRRSAFRPIRLGASLSLAALLAAAASCQTIDSGSETEYLPSLPAPVTAARPPSSRAPAPATRPAPQAVPSASSAPVSAAWPSGAPSIVARSAIIIDNHTGEVLYEKNPDLLTPVASTQKLLTALTIIESGGLDDLITVAESDTAVEPHKIGIAPGERYTGRDLLEALLVRSGNDIAHCLARNHAGSVPAFAQIMNRRARSLGMYSSHFVNASGLTAEGQHSTARDLSVLARAALRNPTIASMTRKRTATFRFPDGRTKTLENTNKLLEKSPYCHGIKTGYTRASGRCLVSCGTREGRTVIVVVLRSGWDEVWIDSKKLLHWALGVS